MNNETIELHLFNLTGVDLMEDHMRTIKDNILELDIVDLPAGIYILSLPLKDRNIQHRITKL